MNDWRVSWNMRLDGRGRCSRHVSIYTTRTKRWRDAKESFRHSMQLWKPSYVVSVEAIRRVVN